MPPRKVSEDAAPQSIVAHYGMQSSSCGYCNSKSGNHTFMMRAGADVSGIFRLGLTVGDYKALLDRGWRRSGSLLYKPDLGNSCCQQYTIRLDADRFKPSKEQRKTLNRWRKYVLGEEYIYKAARKYPIPREEKKQRRMKYSFTDQIHAPELEVLKPKTPPAPKHELVVTLEPNTFSEEKFELYKHYQMKIHGDKPGQNKASSFTRFLCTNPFKPTYSTDATTGQKYGAFHQCYRLDGKLVALSVIDLLPDCVSGVYFIYHESVRDWSPGKLSALREAAMANELGYRYYYMGFYIHTCPKMKYKAAYSPSFILDPESYNWHAFNAEFKQRLDQRPFLGAGREEEGEYLTASADKKVVKDEGDDDDEEEDYYAGTVFTNCMSGAMTLQQVEGSVDLGKMKITVNRQFALAEHLVSWETMDVRDAFSIKCMLAELVATVGPQLAKRIVVQLTRRASKVG